MKLALLRSITFWSGLLVMGFVCWAWRDSLTSHSGTGYWRCWIEESAGGVLVGYDSKLNNEWLAVRRDGPSSVVMDGPNIGVRYWEKGTPPQSAWPKLLSVTKSEGFYVLLPFWLILLAVAAVWLGLLFWRAGRRAGAAKIEKI